MSDKPKSERTSGEASTVDSLQQVEKTLSEVADKVAATLPPEPVAEVVNFPSIKRQFFDVLHDDERHEVWIGMKLRQTIKGQRVDQRTGQRGSVEDMEVSADAIGCLVGIDAAKQEIVLALTRDAQLLNEQRQRQDMLKTPTGPQRTSILDRASSALGRAFSAGKTLIH